MVKTRNKSTVNKSIFVKASSMLLLLLLHERESNKSKAWEKINDFIIKFPLELCVGAWRRKKREVKAYFVSLSQWKIGKGRAKSIQDRVHTQYNRSESWSGNGMLCGRFGCSFFLPFCSSLLFYVHASSDNMS